MVTFEITELMREREVSGELYHEFLRVPSMSAGLYVLPAGGTDPQQPHTEDEIYVVLRGRAVIHVAGDDRPVEEGSIVFVEAGDKHHFHSITEELALLVLFAPAEYTRREE